MAVNDAQSLQGGIVNTPQYVDDEIDLRELFSVLWRGKLTIIIVTFISTAIAAGIALNMPNIYRSEVLLAPAESSGGGMGGLMQKYGGLASLAGISLPGGGEASKEVLAMEVLKSRKFLADFINRRNILVPLLATKKWDSQSGEIVVDDEIYDLSKKLWFRKGGAGVAEPSSQKAYKAFMSLLTVSQDKKSGFVTVAIEHQSPVLAQQWVTWLVVDINNHIREQEVEEAKKSIEYLRKKIQETALADLQAVFFELIQQQTQTIMLAQVRSEFVFKTIDPAVVPESKVKPKRALICVFGLVLGFILALFGVLVNQRVSVR